MLNINNNSAANSILQNLNNINTQLNTSYQELSTGNRVSSAANDPAGYAISQQMTSQVNGLNQATQNAQNGISMIQTATGAMNQIEQVMQTMSTLATEASNAGNTYSDRANLQLEMNALAQQINSTTNQTQYNSINLLTGQYAATQSSLTLQIGANQNQTMSFNIAATDAESLGVGQAQTIGVSVTNPPTLNDATSLATSSWALSAGYTNSVLSQNFANGVAVSSGTSLAGTYTLSYKDTTNGTGSNSITVNLLSGTTVIATGTTSASGATMVSMTDTNGDVIQVTLASASALFSTNVQGSYTATDSITFSTGMSTGTISFPPATNPYISNGNFATAMSVTGNGLTGTSYAVEYLANTSSTGTVTGITVELISGTVSSTGTVNGTVLASAVAATTNATNVSLTGTGFTLSVTLTAAGSVFTGFGSGTYLASDVVNIAAPTVTFTGTAVSTTPIFATSVTQTSGVGYSGSNYTLEYVANTVGTGTVSGITVELISGTVSSTGTVNGTVLASGSTTTSNATTVTLTDAFGDTFGVGLATATSIFTATATGTFFATGTVNLTAGVTLDNASTPSTLSAGVFNTSTSMSSGTGGNYTAIDTSTVSMTSGFANAYLGQDLKLQYTATTGATGTPSSVTLTLMDQNGNTIGTQTLSGTNALNAQTVSFTSGSNTLSINLATASNLFTTNASGTYSQTDSIFVNSSYASLSNGNGGTMAGYTAGTAGNGGVTVSGSVTQAGSGNSIASSITANNSTLSAGQTLKLVYSATTNASGTVTGGSLQLEDSSGNSIGSSVSLIPSQVQNGANSIVVGDQASNSVLTVNMNEQKFMFNATGAGTYTQTDTFTLASSTSTMPTQTNGWSAAANVNAISILSQNDAQNAITKIQSAISMLSSQQAQLGAVQNRLNYTVSNLQNSSQNLQNASSTITNTDMAQAYTQFSQQQVLEQVGISMLSQAQQQPQMILKLLQ